MKMMMKYLINMKKDNNFFNMGVFVVSRNEKRFFKVSALKPSALPLPLPLALPLAFMLACFFLVVF